MKEPSDTDVDDLEPPSMQSAITLAAPEALPAVRLTGTRPEAPAERYVIDRILGEGGMGEVLLVDDSVIGRSVALKQMRGDVLSRSDFRSRFVREARMQGQLEHPSIVPVYELGVGDNGAPFFTMRRISGHGLDGVIELLGDGAPEAEREFSLRKRLQIFQQVCLGVAYAHSRGVVHRDLKPGNVMLGHFGEVYILDWGLALVPDDPHDTLLTDDRAPGTDDGSKRTRAGQVLGTPGYMSPEQAADAHAVDERADVYSLGAILFELLALRALHAGVSGRELVRSTQAGADARASERAPDENIPPELDVICVKATALDPKHRYLSALALHEAIDRFLDGRKDKEQRRRMAARHVKMAQAAADRRGREYREEALREASRALALDPESTDAREIVNRLGLTPPAEVPSEIRRAVAQENDRENMLASRIGMGVFGLIVPLPLYVAATSPAPGIALACAAALALAVVFCGLGALTKVNHPVNVLRISASVSAAIALGALLSSPIAMVPQLAVAAAVAVSTPALGRYRWIHLSMSCLAVVVPSLLDWTGLIGRTMTVSEAGIRIAGAGLAHLSGKAIFGIHVTATLLALAGAAYLMARLDDNLRDQRRRLHYRLWMLGKLVPGGGNLTTSPQTTPDR